MAKIRAYKLAEELGIERNEFVEQAGTHGIELKNAMASLTDDQVELLRDKMGSGGKSARKVDERRLEGKAGTTVVRRRRKKEPEPEPVPEPVVEAAPEEEVAPVEPVPETIADAADSAPAAEVTTPATEGGEEAAAPADGDPVPAPVAAAENKPAAPKAPAAPRTAPAVPAADRDGRTGPATPGRYSCRGCGQEGQAAQACP